MNGSTKSLAVPDVDVWLALLLADHVHREAAVQWWRETSVETIAFCRFTQMSVLRLLTTAPVMKNRPLTMAGAWRAYDRLFDDDRVSLLPEPASLDRTFRQYSSGRQASPKVWADAYMSAFARGHDGALVTFDRALGRKSQDVILLPSHT